MSNLFQPKDRNKNCVFEEMCAISFLWKSSIYVFTYLLSLYFLYIWSRIFFLLFLDLPLRNTREIQQQQLGSKVCLLFFFLNVSFFLSFIQSELSFYIDFIAIGQGRHILHDSAHQMFHKFLLQIFSTNFYIIFCFLTEKYWWNSWNRLVKTYGELIIICQKLLLLNAYLRLVMYLLKP